MRTAANALLAGEPRALPALSTCALLGGGGAALVGYVLGAASGEPWLALFAAIKVPLLVVLATLLCLPSLYVVNTVLGLRADLGLALRGICAAEATLGLTLGALAPLTLLVSLSVFDPYLVTLLDGVLFAVATFAAQKVLARHYAPLVARDPRHRVALRAWLVLFVFAGIQMAWVLRPFRGTPGFPVEFLRAEAFEQNAYVVVFEHFLRLLR